MLNRSRLILLVVFLIVFDLFVWQQIVFSGPNKNTEVYFFDIGQGDSELINLPAGVQILIDGGPNRKVLEELAGALALTDHYLDLVILSHPQHDHFAGLIEVLKRYEVGAFIYNGRKGEAKSFADLEKILKEKKIRTIILAGGDKIKYRNNQFDILSPSADLLKSKELNDTSLVIKLKDDRAKFLFTGDISAKVEKYLAENFDINIDVLKVSHHGSRYSSSEEFLEEAKPKISIIEVGRNSYGHPTEQVLNRLASVGSQIFRTDNGGAIKLIIDDKNKIIIFRRK